MSQVPFAVPGARISLAAASVALLALLASELPRCQSADLESASAPAAEQPAGEFPLTRPVALQSARIAQAPQQPQQSQQPQQLPRPRTSGDEEYARTPVRLKPIADVNVNIAVADRDPALDQAQERFNQEPEVLQRIGSAREWEPTPHHWEAPAMCHRPLYFEDENLERYGYSYGIAQPAVSTVHFAGRFLTLPYLAGAFPHHECVYTLGRYRPGSCAPYGRYRLPLSARGAFYQAGAVAGLAYIVP